MTGVKEDEPKITDPSATPHEPDLRLTMREWVTLWKVKYEQTLARLDSASRFIDQVKLEWKKLKAERDEWKAKFEQLDAQYKSEQATREAAAKGEDLVLERQTEPLPTKAKAKGFRRKKG